MADEKPPRSLEDILTWPGPLSERLAAYSRLMAASDSPFTAEYDRLVERLAAGHVGELAPGVGAAFAPFVLPNSAGKMVSLDELLAEGHLVLSFNRGHWCPFCRIELDALAAVDDQIRALGGQSVSIMPERAEHTAALEIQTGNRIRILSDIGNSLALELGLAMWVGDDVKALLTAEDIRLDLYSGDDGWLLPLPATFVIARDGTVAGRFVDPDFRDRMDVEDIIGILERLPR